MNWFNVNPSEILVFWIIFGIEYKDKIISLVGCDTGPGLFTFSSRQDRTVNEIEMKVKVGAVFPGVVRM